MLAGGEKFTVTPTYHVFDMFKEHQGGTALRTLVSDNEDIRSRLSVSSSEKDGIITVTLANLSCDTDETVELNLLGRYASIAPCKAVLLTADDVHAHNTFDAPETVKPRDIEIDTVSSFTVPHASIMSIEIKTRD